ncbi:MAG: class I tRNA ligase family protein, partial [Armatimonadota bacterium]|nr:class I tRNA ligase family protein [Armatimonadota bacterium]
SDFNPARDRVDPREMPESDRWALHRLQEVIERVTAAYDTYRFHRAYHELHNFCAVDLSAFYLDMLKDRLYASPAASKERRAAQTVLYEVAVALCVMLAPVLVHTADEAWTHLPPLGGRPESVHLAEFPVVNEALRDCALASRWEQLLAVREQVMKALEEARQKGEVAQPLEAHVRLRASGALLELLQRYEADLATLFIVSRVTVEASPDGELVVLVGRAPGVKCERCWLTREDVGLRPEHPALCARCAAAVLER